MNLYALCELRTGFVGGLLCLAAVPLVLAGTGDGLCQLNGIDETVVIQARIDAAAERGGGRVVVQKGVHRCGTIRLKSGVELHLEDGAVLQGGSKPEDYDEVIPEEMVYRYGDENTKPTVTRKAFVIAEEADGVAITGNGEIRIDGPAFFDRSTSLWGYWWAKPPCPRPRAVVMYRCRNVRFEGVTFRDCPLWTMWLRLCDGITIDGITIDAEQKMINSDGIDFDGCRHVRVGNSRFKTGDDCLVLRAIRHKFNADEPVVTEDVVVSNCVLNSFCQGVRIGCPSDDTIRDAVFRDITFTGLNGIVSKQPRVYLEKGCSGNLKTDGILFENWRIDCYGHPVEILVEPGIALRDFGHMTFRNIEVKAKKPFVVRGNELTPLKGVRFENVRGSVSSGKPFDTAFAPDLSLERVEVSGEAIRTIGPGGGGWIECVLPSRHDPKRFFAGCDVGGFYFSPDGGKHWEIRNRGLGNPMVETIAEDPSNPSRILIGGDGGLYVSDNMGLEWRHLTNGLPRPKNKGHSLPVKRVAWDETNPRRIYAATGCPRGKGREAGMFGHVYRSDDGGDTWAMVVRDGDPLIAERPTEIYDLSLNAMDGADLLVITSRGLFRSRDAGVSWRKTGAGLPPDTLARALSRSAVNPGRVYLAMRDKKPKPFPHEASVWRSDDGGETWTRTAQLSDPHRVSDGREPMDAWGRSCVAADPSDPDTVWCGGIWFKQGLCVSHDGGRSWSVAVDKLPYGWIDEFWRSPAVSLAVARANPRTVAFGTSSGIYRTEDGGATWTQCYTAERRSGEAIAGTGLDVLCVSEIVPDRFARGRWFAAFYDVGLMVTEDEGKSWTRCMGGIPKSHAGICSTVAQSPTEPDLCWAVFGTWGGGGRGLPARSVDGGRTWTLVRNPKGWTEGLARNMQVLSSAAPYALAVAHAKMGLVTSGDGGESWAAMSTNALPCARRVVSLAVAGGALYAGTASKGGVPPQVWRSADKGRTWDCIFAPASSEADGSVEGMAVSGRRIAVVVKCIGKRGGCWLSEDGGATWRRVYHEKPWNDLNAVAFCGGRLFLASRNARWHDDGFGGRGLVSVGLGAISQDGWRRHAAGGFDRPEIMCLVADPFDDRRLLVGTWGNSISVFLL